MKSRIEVLPPWGKYVSLIGLIGGSALIGQQSTGSIQGTVLDQGNNKAISGAYVTATRSGLPPSSQTVKSASDGSFQLQGLSAGTYTVCVQVVSQAYLNPCDWSGNGRAPVNPANSVSINAGQKSTGTTLKLQTGSILTVKMQDTAQLLNQKTKSGYAPDLMLGVAGPARTFHQMRAAAADATGTTYQVVVPFDMPLNVQVKSRALKLGDATGAALAANATTQAFQHATGESNPKTFTFTVLGLNP
ncbi:MAG TPA: carboxypeptidase-like regulatory domain-containing protein [Bryobacteraceae bacterium]